MSDENVPSKPDVLDYLCIDVDVLYAKFLEGWTLVSLADEIGTTSANLVKALSRRGYSLERKAHGGKWTPEKIESIKVDYYNGMTQVEIAEKWGKTQQEIAHLMKRWGIQTRDRHHNNLMDKKRRLQGGTP